MTSLATLPLPRNDSLDVLECNWPVNASGIAADGENCSGSLLLNAHGIAHGLSGCPPTLVPLLPTVVAAVFVIVGVPSNILLAAVWSRPGLKGASTYYLAVTGTFASLYLAINFMFWGAAVADKASIFHAVTVCKAHLVLTTGSSYTVTAITLVIVLQRFFIIKQASPPGAPADVPTSPSSAAAPSTVQPSAPEEDPDDPVQHVAILIAVITFTLGIMGGMHVIFWGPEEPCALRKDISYQYIIYGFTADGLFGIVLPIAILVLNVMLRNKVAEAARASVENRLSEQALDSILMIRTMSCYRAVCVLVGTVVGVCEFLFLPLSAIASVGFRINDWTAYTTYCQINQVVALFVKTHFVFDACLCAISSAAFRRRIRGLLGRGRSGSKMSSSSIKASRNSRLSAAGAVDMVTSQSKPSMTAYCTQANANKQPNGIANDLPKYDVVVSARVAVNQETDPLPAAV